MDGLLFQGQPSRFIYLKISMNGASMAIGAASLGRLVNHAGYTE